MAERWSGECDMGHATEGDKSTSLSEAQFNSNFTHDVHTLPGNATLPSGDGDSAQHSSAPSSQLSSPDEEWYSRAYLPHFDGRDVMQHVTFHLADSLPQALLLRLREELRELPAEQQELERRKRIETWIDAGHGSCVLCEPAVANMVQDALLHFDAQRYRLLAWVVMPNHVHVLFQPIFPWTVTKIVATWKKFTATRISAFRRLSGAPGNATLPSGEQKKSANQAIGVSRKSVWFREYWDRYIRDDRHFQRVVEYIRQNPVRAGLTAMPEDWPWSSAHYRVNSSKLPGNAILPNGE